jgi:hypothetical protein
VLIQYKVPQNVAKEPSNVILDSNEAKEISRPGSNLT